MIARIRLITILLILVSVVAGCSKNYIRSGLANSNPAVMEPGPDNTIYIQTGNTSENQQVSLAGLNSRIRNKGYEVITDPGTAYYWLQTRVVYCHEAKEGVTAEKVARTGFGAGIGSGGSPMIDYHSLFGGTKEDQQKSPDIKAIIDKILEIAGKTIPGVAPPPPEGAVYLCVADVRITENDKNGSKTEKTGPSELQMRTVAYVIQKNLDIQEATPIIQAKLTAGIAGMF